MSDKCPQCGSVIRNVVEKTGGMHNALWECGTIRSSSGKLYPSPRCIVWERDQLLARIAEQEATIDLAESRLSDWITDEGSHDVGTLPELINSLRRLIQTTEHGRESAWELDRKHIAEMEAELAAGARELRRYVEGNGFQWCDDESTVFNVTTAIGLMGGTLAILNPKVKELEAELSRLRDNPRTPDVCHRCKISIGAADATVTEGGRHYHALCKVADRAEAAERERDSLRDELAAMRSRQGADDDALPLSNEWLTETLGDQWILRVENGNLNIMDERPDEDEEQELAAWFQMVGRHDMVCVRPEIKTRGDVRALAKALGVKG